MSLCVSVVSFSLVTHLVCFFKAVYRGFNPKLWCSKSGMMPKNLYFKSSRDDSDYTHNTIFLHHWLCFTYNLFSDTAGT